MKLLRLPKNVVFAYIGLATAYLIWSAAGPIIKLTLHSLSPFTFLFLRFLIVGAILLPYTLYILQRIKIDKKDYLNIVLLGIFSQSSIILIFVALKYTTALDAALISTAGPLLSMAAGHYFYNDKINSAVKYGTIITLLGTLVITIEPTFSHLGGDASTSQRIMGNLLVMLYNLAYLLFIIWTKISLGQTSSIVKKTLHFVHIKPFTKHYPTTLTTALSFYVGLLTMIPFAIGESAGIIGNGVPVDFFNLNGSVWLGLMFLAIFSSIVAYFLFEWSLSKVTVTDTAIMSYLQPLVTMPFAYLLLRELPTKTGLVGTAIIFAGVALAEIGSHIHSSRKLKALNLG